MLRSQIALPSLLLLLRSVSYIYIYICIYIYLVRIFEHMHTHNLQVKGEPYLSDLNTGRFNGAHTPKLFRAAYAPGTNFYCWKGRSPSNLTVQQYWQMLSECFLVPLSGMYCCSCCVAQRTKTVPGMHACSDRALNATCGSLIDTYCTPTALDGFSLNPVVLLIDTNCTPTALDGFSLNPVVL
jgi:hypothetical protein